ncbi:MAG: hypothetical protein Q8J84_01705 [Flavobacteriaceae bacterium]|nr:hypothetical protein [Flavobacteriaceae bacterium]
MENKTIEEGKILAIVSYLTYIGTIIAFILNNQKKNEFASFHIRQAVGLGIIFLLVEILTAFSFHGIFKFAFYIFLLVLWFIGFIGAINGEYKKVPILGDAFQQWFKNYF